MQHLELNQEISHYHRRCHKYTMKSNIRVISKNKKAKIINIAEQS